jgi:hypothetical protein
MATQTPPLLNSFDVSEWLDGKTVEGLPLPPDRYQPGGIKWGSNPERGRGIQRARSAKKKATNRAAFIELLPSVKFESNADALSAALNLQHDPLALSYGWQYWQKGKAASWVHESDAEKLAKCVELGATRTK